MSVEAREWTAREFVGRRQSGLDVLLAMADLADQAGVLQASLDTIAGRANVSRATAKRALARLVAGKVIYRERRWQDGKRVPDLTVLGPIEPQRAREPMWAIPGDLLPESLTPEVDPLA